MQPCTPNCLADVSRGPCFVHVRCIHQQGNRHFRELLAQSIDLTAQPVIGPPGAADTNQNRGRLAQLAIGGAGLDLCYRNRLEFAAGLTKPDAQAARRKSRRSTMIRTPVCGIGLEFAVCVPEAASVLSVDCAPINSVLRGAKRAAHRLGHSTLSSRHPNGVDRIITQN